MNRSPGGPVEVVRLQDGGGLNKTRVMSSLLKGDVRSMFYSCRWILHGRSDAHQEAEARGLFHLQCGVIYKYDCESIFDLDHRYLHDILHVI